MEGVAVVVGLLVGWVESDMEKVTKATLDQLLMDLYLDNILPGMGGDGVCGGCGGAVGWLAGCRITWRR